MVLFCFDFPLTNFLTRTRIYFFSLFLLPAFPILEIFALIRRATWSTTISE